MSKSPRDPKRTAPTTIRFKPELREWLRDVSGPLHHEGMAGVVNDAVEAFKELQEDKTRRIIDGVLDYDRK